MAKAEVEGPPEAGGSWRLKFDDLARVLGLAIAVIGVGQYFYDRADARANAARAQALGYIETWAGAPMLEVREALYGFWQGQPELIGIFRDQALSERQYRAMLGASVFRHGADDAIREPLLVLDNFFSQVSYCERSGLCDEQILDDYFCALAGKNAVAYGPFFEQLAERTGDSGIGAELRLYAGRCG